MPSDKKRGPAARGHIFCIFHTLLFPLSLCYSITADLLSAKQIAYFTLHKEQCLIS
uniref:Uncharacterized protein n=1 Tax=Rhizophora mucronata TaxID=61149 RepID=A0A2P2NU46_RHIMU